MERNRRLTADWTEPTPRGSEEISTCPACEEPFRDSEAERRGECPECGAELTELFEIAAGFRRVMEP